MNHASLQVVQESKEEIPDEEEDATKKKVSMFSLLHFVPHHKWLFWTGFLGSIARAAFPTIYSYCSSVLQELLFTFDLNRLWKDGWVCVYIMIGFTIVNALGTLYNWVAGGIVGEQMIMNLYSSDALTPRTDSVAIVKGRM